jgi:hypothetical protein
MMNAIVQMQYGSPDVLRLRDIDKPAVTTMRSWYACAQQASISATGIS